MISPHPAPGRRSRASHTDNTINSSNKPRIVPGLNHLGCGAAVSGLAANLRRRVEPSPGGARSPVHSAVSAVPGGWGPFGRDWH